MRTLRIILCVGSLSGTLSAVSDPVVQVSIRQKKYCLGQPGGFGSLIEQQPSDAVTLRLRVHLSYRNVSDRPLIVPRFYYVRGLLVTSSSMEGEGRSSPFVAEQVFGSSMPLVDVTHGNPNWYFTTIPPQSAGGDTDEYVVLRVFDPTTANVERQLLGKRVFLQLDLDHRRFSPKVAGQLKKKWEKDGDLWTGRIKTSTFEVDVPQTPEFSNCDAEYHVD